VRTFGRQAGLLSAGVGAAGVLTYAYFALAAHQLDGTSYGEIVVLWTAVFVSVSILYRPVEQLLSRTIADRRARGIEIGSALRVAATIQLAIAAACAIAMLALRGPLQDGLFSGSRDLYWVMFGAVIVFGASFYARGYLAGRRRFALLAGLLVCESASRAAFALAVAIGIASGQTAVALGVFAAPCFSLVVVPLAFGRRAVEEPVATPAPADGRVSLATGGGFAAAVFVIMLSEQTLLNAGPLLARAFEGAAEAGFVFNVLMLARAPLLVFQGVATSLLPHLTRLRARGEAGADEFALSIRGTLRAVAAFTLAVAVIVLAAGPELMQLAFSSRFEYDRAGLLLVTLGMGLYLAATTLNQAALARGRVRPAAACWAGCAAGFLVWGLLPVFHEARRIEIGFAAAALCLALALWALNRGVGPPGRDVAPDSVEELEARLAIADEAS
jgi:O-antigen/teichoic acid export membrane protein